MAHFSNHAVTEAIVDTAFDNGGREMILALSALVEGAHTRASHRTAMVEFMEVFLRHAAGSTHGRDLVIALAERCHDVTRSEMLARVELTAGGFSPEEIEETLAEFPEVAGKYMRSVRPTRRELDEAGAI